MTKRRSDGRLTRAIAAARAEQESGAAIVSAILAILVTATMSILVLGTIVSEVLPTAFLQSGSQTIFAAEAGVHAVLGQIRTAEAPPDFTGAIYGEPDDLPCTASGPVDSAGSVLGYTATIAYFLEDPTSKNAAWVGAHKLSCTPGSGPAQDPAFALITSVGEGEPVRGLGTAAADRTVQAVYEFQVTNNNIPGGLIYNQDLDATKNGKYCLEAEDIAVGSYVRYVPASECGTNDDFQLWMYDSSYQIKLAASTIPSLSPDGALCVTGPVGSTLPQRATLQKCTTAWNQLFSWEGGANFRGQQNPRTSGYSNILLSTGSYSVSSGSYLQAWDQDGDQQEWVSFNPDPRVGAGAAGVDTHQIVSYLEFGRCFDVTGEKVESLFMIAYPCKQDPSGGSKLAWNHKWYYNEPAAKTGSLRDQRINIITASGTTYCMKSAGTENGYITLTSACNTAAANQKWTRFAETGNYSTAWTIVDSWGRCVSLGNPDTTLRDWSTLVTQTCTGALGQKWNAPANTVSASVGGYQEIN